MKPIFAREPKKKDIPALDPIGPKILLLFFFFGEAILLSSTKFFFNFKIGSKGVQTMSFSPLPLDSSPLRESLLLTPPLSEQNEFRFSNNNTRLSSYSSNSLSSRPDSFMSTSADSTRPLNPTGRSNLLGERRVSNLSNLQYGTGISEQEKSTEDLGLGLTGTEDEAEKGSVLPESFSSGFGDDNTNYNNKLNSRNNSTYSKIMKGRGKWYLLAAIILSIIVIGGAVGATEMKKSNSNLAANTNGTSTISTSSSSSNNGGSTQTGASNPSSTGISRATTGTDGSTVYATDGSTFIYNNTFGKILTEIKEKTQIESLSMSDNFLLIFFFRWILEFNSF